MDDGTLEVFGMQMQALPCFLGGGGTHQVVLLLGTQRRRRRRRRHDRADRFGRVEVLIIIGAR